MPEPDVEHDLDFGGCSTAGGGPTDEQLSRLNTAAQTLQEALGGLGFLLPGTGPSTIEPDLLPLVRQAQRNRLLHDLNCLGYIAPFWDINDLPRGYGPKSKEQGRVS